MAHSTIAHHPIGGYGGLGYGGLGYGGLGYGGLGGYGKISNLKFSLFTFKSILLYWIAETVTESMNIFSK